MKKSKLLDVISFAFSTSILAGCLYMGVVKQVSGFINMFSFYAWVTLVGFILVSWFYNQDERIKFYLERKDNPVRVLYYWVNAAVVFFLVYHGLQGLAIVFMLSSMVSYSMYDVGRKAYQDLTSNQPTQTYKDNA